MTPYPLNTCDKEHPAIFFYANTACPVCIEGERIKNLVQYCGERDEEVEALHEQILELKVKVDGLNDEIGYLLDEIDDLKGLND